MKKILITAESSFIGNSFEQYVDNIDNWEVEKISLRETSWEKDNWKKYDVVLHVAGISKVDVGLISEREQTEYHYANGVLTNKVAEKAKNDGVRQLVYISSIMIYGNPSALKNEGVIGNMSVPKPTSVYGKSKLEGEKIIKLATNDFLISIVRTPMVYGKVKSGELYKWNSLSDFLLFFPKIDNYRGMIYIDNLCELLKKIILNERKGIFFPQDDKVLSTSELVCELRRLRGKKTILCPGLNWVIKMCCKCFGSINILLGNLYYSEEMTNSSGIAYQIVSVNDALYNTFILKGK